MTNPTPVRSWSRLTSLRSVPAPESHPHSTPPSQPLKPTASAAATAFSANNVVPPLTLSFKSSPPRKTSSPHNNTNGTKSLPTPSPSPSSPAFPPSEVNVNPQIEPKIQVVEEKPKTLLVHKTINEEHSLNGSGSLQKNLGKKHSDYEDSGIRVITIAGENRGAHMNLIQSSKKPNYLHKMYNSNMKGYDYESGKCGNGEENANKKDKSKKARKPSSPPMTRVYMNSNVQCVNNSLLFKTSCTHHDPGVKFTL